MRILFITAFYPPHVVGGWEQLVQDINQHMAQRGHITHVLTSHYGLEGPAPAEEGVERVLNLEADLVNYNPLDFFLKRQRQLEANLSATREIISRFNPDIIFIHVMWNLSKGIAWLAESLRPGRVVYYMANDWPYAPDPHRSYWEDPARHPGKRLVKSTLAPFALKAIEQEEKAFPLKFEHVLCVSEAVRQAQAEHADIPLENMQVVYNGVETDIFRPKECGSTGRGLQLVFAGSLVPHKGVHTAVEAMSVLKDHAGMDGIHLTLIGSGHPDYEARLRQKVLQAGLQDRVTFFGRVERSQMPALLPRFDVLVFPSTWAEPLARVVQEAMACGLVVIGTPTGGTPEILEEGVTGLIFPANNAAALASQIERLQNEPELYATLAENGRRLVEEKFNFERMITEMENFLEKVHAVSSAGGYAEKGHRDSIFTSCSSFPIQPFNFREGR